MLDLHDAVHSHNRTLRIARYAFQKKDIHGRLARCMEFFAEYDLEIKLRKGRGNLVAEVFS